MQVLGIDFGGSGIKGALVDMETGNLVTDKIRIPTPDPSTPEAVVAVMSQIVRELNYHGPIGVGFPSVVINGLIMSAANIDKGWVGYAGQKAIATATGCPVTVLNDADAAGMAEMRFGAGRIPPQEAGSPAPEANEVVMIFTLGTGIGSAMFVNGRLVPNLELGHLYLPGHNQDAEFYASDRIRQEHDMKWKTWGNRLNTYFQHIESLFSPQLIIIGGGVSKKHEKFLPYLQLRAKVIPAQLRNDAGIVGAALAALPTNGND